MIKNINQKQQKNDLELRRNSNLIIKVIISKFRFRQKNYTSVNHGPGRQESWTNEAWNERIGEKL